MSKIDTKDITTELVENSVRELDSHISKFNEKLEELAPVAIFQEKHVTGPWWNRKTYYTYYKYIEGRMYAVSVINETNLRLLEK
jgi:hypothetical protein